MSLTNFNCPPTSFLFFRRTFLPPLKNPNFHPLSPSRCLADPPHFQFLKIKGSSPTNFNSFRTLHWPLRAFESDGIAPNSDSNDTYNVDAFLSICEFLFLASSALLSITMVVNSSIPSLQKPVMAWLGNRMIGYQFLLLVSAMIVGFTIRRRQWGRICSGFSNPRSSGVNLLHKVEKLEEDLGSSATIIRVLSRQVEKLGMRFRVTRKELKELIAETAALAQKNSEATRVLAMQEDILEKELGEIQKVLLAMQEQQQKQLELILAIGKTGKLWDRREGHAQHPKKVETHNSAPDKVNQIGADQIRALSGQNDDRD